MSLLAAVGPSVNSALTDAERRQLAALRAHKHGYERFEDFIKRVAPRYWPIPRHLQPLVDLIERSRHEQIRALVSLAPRHGKTVTFMLGLAWRVLLDPACQNFYTSFHSSLSEHVGRSVRQLVTERLGIPLDRSSKSNSEWNTVYGGGLKSTSIGGGIMGRGANGGLVVIDDILKGWITSQSQQIRDQAYVYATTDVMSRLEGGGSMIICGTRWHPDDPIGRLLEDGIGEDWEVVNSPAIGDIETGEPIDERVYPDRAVPLWTSIDERSPNNAAAALEWYRKIRLRGEAQWWALYQGVPLTKEEQMFLEPSRYALPLEWKGCRCVLVLDPAATEKQTADYSALGCFAMRGFADDANMFVHRIKKMRQTQPQVAREALMWQRSYRMVLAVESVGAFAGIPAMLRETAPGIRLLELQPGSLGWIAGNKKIRATPVSGAWNSSRVHVPLGRDANGGVVLGADGKVVDLSWVDDYIKVVRSFTGAKGNEDDVTDITAHAWNILHRNLPSGGRDSYSAPSL